MTAEQPDYFSNHRRAGRFPWSLYHGPIEADLLAFLKTNFVRDREADVLVVGCGLLQEADEAPPHIRLHVIDIDPRAIEAVQRQGHRQLASGTLVAPDQPLASLGRQFDGAYAKEVIEHILGPEAYLRDLRSVLAPGAPIWLSTPNYGEPWLPLIEMTFLELVARMSGYARAALHPTKFSRTRLALALRRSGFTDVQVRTVARRLALVATARVDSR